MGEIQVDMTGAQSLQTQFATFDDMRCAEVACSAIGLLVSKERADFGDNDHLFAASEFLQRLPQKFLGQSEAIAFSRVEEIDPGIERGLNHVARSGGVARIRHIAALPIVAPRPGHRSEADNGNVQIGFAKVAVLHGGSLAEATGKSTQEELEQPSLSERLVAGAVAVS